MRELPSIESYYSLTMGTYVQQTASRLWRASTYKIFCATKVELWRRERANYEKAKAQEDYVKVKNGVEIDIETASADDLWKYYCRETNLWHLSLAKVSEESVNILRLVVEKIVNEKKSRQIATCEKKVNEAEAEIEKANADDPEAIIKDRRANGKLEAEYKNKKIKHHKRFSRKTRVRFKKAQKEAEDMEEEKERDQDEDNGKEGLEQEDMLIGVNIKLSFQPHGNTMHTRKIRLIQFKRPFCPDANSTDKGWSIDAPAGDIYPYFGWNNEDKAKCHFNEYKAKFQHCPPPQKKGPGAYKNSNQRSGVHYNVRELLGLTWEQCRQGKREKRVVRGVVPELLGRPLAREGNYSSKASNPAHIIDTPREMCHGPKVALYATYAYDLDNQKWLGGVAWGYRLYREPDGRFRVETPGLRKRSGGAPLRDEEGATRSLWMKESPWGPPPGRIPVPPDESSA
ncbi:hypothetical protein MMC07_004322 [Pseudocyphellaria aurata]|nr:hypothetical protein [Pseudocyphellaria aurata]